MSTLRVSNIEAKADVSSPTVDEKIKFTNSSGDVLFHLDGKTSGITTVGINTTGNTFTVNNTTGDVSFSGSVTSSGVSTFSSDVSIADKIVHIGDTDTAIRFPSADTFTVETAGSERLRVNSSGNVGIGTVTPLALYRSLGIHGPANDQGGLLDLATKDLSSRGYVFNDSNGLFVQTATNHPIILRTNNTERLRITSDGTIGIGKEPSSWDTGSSTTAVQIENSVLFDYVGAQFDVGHNYYYDGSNYRYISNGYSSRITQHKNDGSIRFWSGGTGVADATYSWSEALRITSSGNVGIGTDNPGDLLTLYGTDPSIKLQDSSGDAFSLIEGDNTDEGSLRFRADPLGAGANTHIRFDTDGSERLRIDSSGNIGINSTSPKTNLDISQQTGAVALPQGTTAQRPSGTAPYIRKNTTNNALEYYDGTSWVEIITDYFPTGSVILG